MTAEDAAAGITHHAFTGSIMVEVDHLVSEADQEAVDAATVAAGWYATDQAFRSLVDALGLGHLFIPEQ